MMATAAVFRAALALSLAIPPAAAQRLPWSSIDPKAAVALRAFRQTDHWVAEALEDNYDGERLGRHTEERRSYNFDPASDLRYRVVGMRQGAPPAVFLLFEWSPVRGNARPLASSCRKS
ncbi:hypothetical protein [Falsiroseomonas stagni]|uniref:Uncharacterized protein n=1 Tax=Falsiroseomonas stagni DSM 19981 TaxID=1123062 RepID=A0A1I4AUC5_9PROT|nr:hypothetical protein [Falsiroseomonas stagni]SFK60148.1 hypothetical protein SAMN02745775_104190 [Falsiroseomonas stagni DSM 19981]